MSAKINMSEPLTTFIDPNILQQDRSMYHYNKLLNEICFRTKKIKANKNSVQKNKMGPTQKSRIMKDHKASFDELERKYQTNLKNGLSSEEARERLERNGPNQRSEASKTHWTLLLLKEVASLFYGTLWMATTLCFIHFGLTKDYSILYLGVALIAIMFINGITIFIQKKKTKEQFQPYAFFILPEAIVIRDEIEKRVISTQLVVGDIVRIEMGKKIPADLIVIDAIGLKVDNSLITGEPNIIPRSTKCTDNDLFFTENIAFAHTLCKEGRGIGLVFATGDDTFISSFQLSDEEDEIDRSKKSIPFLLQVNRLIKHLSIFSYVSGGILFFVGFAVGLPVEMNLITMIGIILANVPEGLLFQVSLSLDIIAKRLASKKVFILRLNLIQQMKKITCMCIDKVGTLTENKLLASHLWYNGILCKSQRFQGQKSQKIQSYDINSLAFKSLQQVAIGFSSATFNFSVPYQILSKIKDNYTLTSAEKEQKIAKLQIQWQQQLKNKQIQDIETNGDAAESALIKFYQPIEDIELIRKKYPRVEDYHNVKTKTIYNRQQKKFSYSIHSYEIEDSHFCIFAQGGPQIIWSYCEHILINQQLLKIDEEWNHRFMKIYSKLRYEGQKILGYAKLHLPKTQYSKDYQFNYSKIKIGKQLCFVGLFSSNNPMKENIPKTISKLRTEGIKIIMTTGDSIPSALASARKCNIITEETVNEIAQRQGKTIDELFEKANSIVVSGDDLRKMEEEQQSLPEVMKGKRLMKWLTKREVIFARVGSYHKWMIVKCCKKIGENIAVTGDGIGDCAALRDADIGIAMGMSSSESAKMASDIILMDDDINSITYGLEESRRAIHNMKKLICFTLTTHISQMMPFVLFVVFQIPCPITGCLILYISLLTDLFHSLSFVFDQQQVYSFRKKNKSEKQLINLGLLSQAYGYQGWIQFWGALFSYFVVFNDFGYSPSSLFHIANVYSIDGNESDVYNSTHPFYGNTYLQANYSNKCPDLSSNSSDSHISLVDWISTDSASQDLRLSLLSCKMQNNEAVYTHVISWSACNIQQISPFTNLPVCYTTEACKYAQTAYFISIIWSQIINSFICKTRKYSFLSLGLKNHFSYFAITVAIFLTFLITYCQPFNTAFNLRDNIFLHFGTPSIPFCILQFCIDEVKKYCLRRGEQQNKNKPNWMLNALSW